jgi:hypothetical protein
MVACGPRMKPVEYEEPSKNVSANSEVDDAPSSGSASSSSSSSGGDNASDESAAKPASGGSCKNKKCGDTCSECPPGDEACMEVLLLKQCNPKGECVPAKVECSSGEKKDDKSKDSKSKDKATK